MSEEHHNPEPNYLSKDKIIIALATLMVVAVGWFQTLIVQSFNSQNEELREIKAEVNGLRVEFAKIETRLKERIELLQDAGE